MTLETIIAYLIIILGIVSIFRPILLIYLFSAVPVFAIALTISQYDTEFKILRIGTVNVYATDFLIAIMNIGFFFIILKIMVQKNDQLGYLIKGPINKAICIYMIWEVIIGFISYTYNGFYLQNVLRQLSFEFLMFIAVFIRAIVTDDKQIKAFFNYMIAMAVFLVVVASLRYLLSYNISITSSGTIRSISGNAICIMMLPLCYILFRKDPSYNNNSIASYAIPIVLICGIILAGHRSGYIVLLLILSVSYMTKRESSKQLFIPLWGITLLVFILVLPKMINISPQNNFLGDLVKRFDDTFNMENKTITDRLDIWKYSLDILKEKPIVGIASLPVYLRSKNDNDRYTPKSQTQLQMPSHNMFVDKIIHEGILGLIILLYLVFTIFKQIIISSKNNSSYSLFYLVYVVSFLVFSTFNTTFTNSTGKTLLFIVVGFLNYDIKKNINSPKMLKNEVARNIEIGV